MTYWYFGPSTGRCTAPMRAVAERTHPLCGAGSHPGPQRRSQERRDQIVDAANEMRRLARDLASTFGALCIAGSAVPPVRVNPSSAKQHATAHFLGFAEASTPKASTAISLRYRISSQAQAERGGERFAAPNSAWRMPDHSSQMTFGQRDGDR